VGSTSGAHDDLPDPSGLNWLLILFFHLEGLIPSPKLIMEQPHERKLFNGMDVGFSDSAEYASDWRDSHKAKTEDEKEFAEEVFKLLYKFFHFCASKLRRPTSEGGGWVVNTRDAELIPASELSSSNVLIENWKLTEIELATIKQKNCAKIIMIHPFFPSWRISTANAGKAFDAMRKSGMKLKNYFEPKAKNGVVIKKREGLGLNEFLDLLKI
jgi:hypothetical protein